MDLRQTQSNTKTAQQIFGRWMREFIFEDWGLKLLALAITIVLWFAVMEQRTPISQQLRGIKLVFVVPNEMEISNINRDEVGITLEGTRHALDRLNVRDMVARVNVTGYNPGERVIKLAPDKILMELPDGVRIKEIEPNTVSLRIEQRVEQDLEVEARLEGKLPEGFEVKGVYVEPARVRVRGPRSHVEALSKAPTETIAVNDRTQSFTDQQISVDIPDPKVTALDAFVSVRVEIGAK